MTATADKVHRRQLTYSGDYYSATSELWKVYWDAVYKDDWETAQPLEERANPEFFYDP